jgi:hypothetical protein
MIEVKELKNKFGVWQAEIWVDELFVCFEYGETEEELLETVKTSTSAYQMLAEGVTYEGAE